MEKAVKWDAPGIEIAVAWQEWQSGKPWRECFHVHPAADHFDPLPQAELQDLADDIRANGLREPVVFMVDAEGKPWLVDGRNRLQAMELSGLRRGGINEECWRTIEGDAVSNVISLNVHRRHLTPEARRKAIDNLLKADPALSDRQVGKMAKADHKTVAAQREKLEARGEIPHVESRKDTKGRKQPAKKKTTTKRKRRTHEQIAEDLREHQMGVAEALGMAAPIEVSRHAYLTGFEKLGEKDRLREADKMADLIAERLPKKVSA